MWHKTRDQTDPLWQKNIGDLLTLLGENKLLLGLHDGPDKITTDGMPSAGLICSSKLSQMETAAATGINI